jgi:hypothetical protein
MPHPIFIQGFPSTRVAGSSGHSLNLWPWHFIPVKARKDLGDPLRNSRHAVRLVAHQNPERCSCRSLHVMAREASRYGGLFLYRYPNQQVSWHAARRLANRQGWLLSRQGLAPKTRM